MIKSKTLILKLTELSNIGLKVFVLHCSPELMLKVVKAALTTRLYNTGHAWFLSEMAFSRDPEVIAQLPEGLLAIDNFWLGGLSDTIASSFSYVIATVSFMVSLSDPTSPDTFVPYDDPQATSLDNRTVVHVGLRHSHKFPSLFKRQLQNVLDCCSNYSDNYDDDKVDNSFDEKRSMYIGGRNVEEFFDGTGQNQGPAFYLLNTVEDGTGTRMWAKVGYITASGRKDLKTVLWPGRLCRGRKDLKTVLWPGRLCRGRKDLKTVLWPGHNIYGPSSSTVKTYRVVTRPAEPFVFVAEQVSRKEECFGDVPCLKVDNSSHSLLAAVVDDFQSEMKSIGQLYTVHCCKGLTLEMLNTLAQNLNFRYVVYFVNDTNYGTFKDGNWTGMVGDVIDGTADIIAGAFSMTSDRMAVLDFTEPYFQNEYAVVTGEDAHYVSIWAFMSPFSGQVWLCIILSSIVAGIATAFLEWRSPFGLNPRGRKRTKNYGLGSGLLMVMVLLTGHTINIKAPKSWPGKVIQNVWAGLAIFIMTSYTANLAAYLAGQSAVSTVKNIFDPELLTKRIAVMKSSAVENYVAKINPSLGKRAKINYVNSTIMAINKLRGGFHYKCYDNYSFRYR
ncbi:Glutamate receptor ionotropic, NMDA 3A [Bulinus truncatus]|nr:Glutamate receptor ionotropic, NMDA 3A [Bulinus truncatus]